MYQRPKSYSAYDHDNLVPLPTTTFGRGEKRKKHGKPAWSSPTLLTVVPATIVMFVLIGLVYHLNHKVQTHRVVIDEHAASAKTSDEETTRLARNLRNAMRERDECRNSRRDLEIKLSQALEKVTNLELFMEQHKDHKMTYAQERSLWENEKSFLHNELEKLRKNFDVSRDKVLHHGKRHVEAVEELQSTQMEQEELQQAFDEKMEKIASLQEELDRLKGGGVGADDERSTMEDKPESGKDEEGHGDIGFAGGKGAEADAPGEGSGETEEGSEGAVDGEAAEEGSGKKGFTKGFERTASIVKQFKSSHNHRFSYSDKDDKPDEI